MKLNKFIRECRENNVLKNLSIYIVSSWVLLQVIALIAEPLGFSLKIVAYGLIALLIGFPLYIYGVWKFQLAPNLNKKPLLDPEGVPVPGKFQKSPFQQLYFSFLAIIALICTGIVLVIVNRNFVKPTFEVTFEQSNKIAVLQFENLTGDSTKNIIGEMAVDWIIHGITRNKLGQVISPQIIDDYSKVLRASVLPADNSVVRNNIRVTEYLKPSKIIEGDYYLRDGRMLFQCSITDEAMNRTLVSFDPVSCDAESPLDCIEAINQRILGYFIEEERAAESLEEHPPRYEAYELFSKAKSWRNEDDRQYLDLLNASIDADPDFFEPKAFRFMYYFNQGMYRTSDSLLQLMRRETGLYDRQQVLLNLYDALLRGNHRNVYRYQQGEYNITPMHLETNSNMMLFSLQLTNRPGAVDSIFQEIDMSEMDLNKCDFCVERYKIKAMSEIDMGNYQQAIALLEPFSRQSGFWTLKKILLRAYVRAGRWEAVEDMMENLQVVSDRNLKADFLLFGAKECLREGRTEDAHAYLDQALPLMDSQRDADGPLLGELLFYRDRHDTAEPYLKEGYQRDSTNFNYGALLAITLYKKGKIEEAEALIGAMENQRGPYQYGEVFYSLAQFYAGTGQEKACLDNLLKAIAEGHWYETGAFHNDPLLRMYYDREAFGRIMRYWQ
ncbi:tetratricopeptide repeat protein [Robiginitalea sediminis]|uniref:tetratricopeptide repeat protein n=1 Tax=Robiginitalea sediminis TaxID=1982593 RepID=UPI000B4BE828|nr:hypothetical protein [Robiginitalea sediminis]